MTDKKKVGNFGELLAARFCRKHGYKIVGRNVRASHKEIDLIMSDKHNIIFSEVKTRLYEAVPDTSIQRPAAAVDFEKRKNTVYAASAYLKAHPVQDKNIRFDVIEVYLIKSKRIFRKYELYSINHIPNAFGAERR